MFVIQLLAMAVVFGMWALRTMAMSQEYSNPHWGANLGFAMVELMCLVLMIIRY